MDTVITQYPSPRIRSFSCLSVHRLAGCGSLVYAYHVLLSYDMNSTYLALRKKPDNRP